MSVRREPDARQSDREVDAILASIADGVIAVDGGWCCTHANPAAERMLQRGAGGLIGVAILDTLAPDADDPIRTSALASKHANAPVAFSAPARRLDAWVEFRGFPHPGGFTMIFRDVTDERLAHRAWLDGDSEGQAQRRANHHLFETTLDLILVVDRKGNIVQVSPSSAAILGYQPAELIGHNAIEFLYAEDLERTRTEMRLARRGRLMRNFETRYVHKDGRAVTLAWT
ncbi:MAG: PAS domain-containing protein, partial [Alphaproteobacteria bacterium]